MRCIQGDTVPPGLVTVCHGGESTQPRLLPVELRFGPVAPGECL